MLQSSCQTCPEAGDLADERLLAAARSDNEDLLLEVFEEGKFDINYKDGYVPHPISFRMRSISDLAARLGNTGNTDTPDLSDCMAYA